MEIVPNASTRDAASLLVPSWAATPAANTRNSVAPDSACEVWCSVVARMSPDSPANRPDAAKAAIVPAAAGTGSRTRRTGPAGRSLAAARGAGAPVSGAPATPMMATAPSTIMTM